MSKNTVAMGIRAKLIIIFILIKVLPLLALAWFSWHQMSELVLKMQSSFADATLTSQEMGKKVVHLASQDSIRALDEKAREAIERLAADTAQDVARFLYERDHDISQAATTPPSIADYQTFLATRVSPIIEHGSFVMDEAGKSWESTSHLHVSSPVVEARNRNNAKDFHYRSPENRGHSITSPLYLEMTFVDLQGQEQVKVTSSEVLSPDLKDISLPANTYCKAETYFTHLKELKPGEIYVSDVIGAYQKTDLIGTYSKVRAEKAGIDFTPQNSAYAGKENPVGKRFQGLVRWATPVVKNGEIAGFVTLALNHDHLMEFTDHTIPTENRYCDISDAGTGNYTFMWDYLGRNISHPRDYFITGYDPQTGQPALPWLEAAHYRQWQNEELNTSDFLNSLPLYQEQSLNKRPAPEQTQSGYVGLDCRYLNFAPQCDGWMNLTQHGGAGSFLIFWSGLWKLTTAATIPYYTGQYSNSERGFGFVTIGANVNEFHSAAIETAKKIEGIETDYLNSLSIQQQDSEDFLKASAKETTTQLVVSTSIMVAFIIIIAIWMASVLTKKITRIITSIRLFQNGQLDQRIDIKSGDEIAELAITFNTLADNIQQSLTRIKNAHNKSEITNQKLIKEVAIRKNAEYALAKHRDSLEHIVSVRTRELKQEISEHEKALDDLNKTQVQLFQAEKLAGIGQLAAGVAHEINTPIQYISDNIKFFQESFNDIDHYLNKCDALISQTPGSENRSLKNEIDRNKNELDMEFLREEIPQAIEQTLVGVNQVAKIVHSMKSFSHPGTKEKTLTNINEAIENTVTVSSNEWKNVADIDLELDNNLPDIPCFSGELNQVLLNILINAAQAVGEGVHSKGSNKGLIRIKTTQDDDNIEISLSDSGPGIPQEIQAKIFDPFFTTKSVGKGTGQGLAISWAVIVEKHGGDIWFETGDTGTTFFIRLPLLS